MQKRFALYCQRAKADLLVIDDFGLTPLGDLLEIFDARYDRCSALITSQLPSISGMPTSPIAPSHTPFSIADPQRLQARPFHALGAAAR